MKIVAVIPARFKSTRFPGKPLALISGTTMIQRVYEQAKKVSRLDEVIVATDDQRIYDAVKAFGGTVSMTKETHQNGTERCAEVMEQRGDVDLVINIQGDEPFIALSQIELLIDQSLLQKTGITTLAKRLNQMEDWLDPNIVKVLFDNYKRVLYFSRAPLPYQRSSNNTIWDETQNYYKHIGLYGYYRNALLEISKLNASPMEMSESLEQLRWLEHGYSIGIAVTDVESIAVDMPEDIQKAEDWLIKNAS